MFFPERGVVISKHNQQDIMEDLKDSLNGTIICVKIKLPKNEIAFYNKVE